MQGKNFQDSALTFSEFIALNENNRAIYSNFFMNLYNCKYYTGRNYQKLQAVDPMLAEELSEFYHRYYENKLLEDEQEKLFGHSFPESIIKKGYQAYLLLRNNFAHDQSIIDHMSLYRSHQTCEVSDDWAALFS
ncbi:MAG: hypothetical protein NT165_02495 [Candidatus Falkowbacteria bacterium]|nr:hypothetical protein [Candidatus Falkowbacteria bacterium]